MGREIVYCSICGERIPAQHVEEKLALKLESRHFCKKCVIESPNVPTLLTNEVSPFYKPATTPRPEKEPPARKAPARLEAPPRKKRSIWVGASLAAVPIVGLLVVLSWPRGGGPAEPAKPEPPREDPAKAALERRAALEAKAAQSASDVVRRARLMADDKKFDQALRELDGFPGEYRETKAWRDVAVARAEVEKEKADLVKKPWPQLFDEGQAAWKSKDYVKAKQLYLAGMTTAPADTAPGDDHSRWQYGHFNLAEILVRDGDLGAAFDHLHKLLLFRNTTGHTCKCQNACVDQLTKYDVWKPVRDDARYAPMMKLLPPR